ncbi:UNVERIFIED_CONTAM: Retrovirus-related Pol polyprotein from transposon TNT 1-94 [Sesamum calycinum]|uniref:Retrovirus-related Pol polyprotein from transposon TNT 1-94 n=1 Tax=Sesamum calycinum TaxID=2727403 RepID=A0AAW2J9J2_9LAMI
MESSNTNLEVSVATTETNSSTDGVTTRVQMLENSSMIMISAPLNGNNCLTCSRSVCIAWEGKDKLGFIDGSDIVNTFLYSSSARSLWVELEAMYGEYDGPLLYIIQREIGSISQGNLSPSAYYTNLKQLWDELMCLCTSDVYFWIMHIWIVLDPLPSVNKAYAMVLRVERQRQVNLETEYHRIQYTSCSSRRDGKCDFARWLLVVLSTIQEPRSYPQARVVRSGMKLRNRNLMLLIKKKGTWEIVELPKGTKPIGCKWVYKVKLKQDGSVENKARLVVKGYNQVKEVDYFDRFSPIAKTVTVRLVFAVALSLDWPVHQVDINNTFLHGFLDEDIYMGCP